MCLQAKEKKGGGERIFYDYWRAWAREGRRADRYSKIKSKKACRQLIARLFLLFNLFANNPNNKIANLPAVRSGGKSE